MNPDQNEIERLRAITHPARWRVLQVLWSGRTLTATQAADIAGITPSAMSYHLRHLAKLGMIERLESDDGRERPWRSISDAPHITLQPDVQLGTAMMQNLMYSVSRTVGVAPPESGDTRPWPAAYSQGTLKLTRAQAKELNRRIGGADRRVRGGGGCRDGRTVCRCAVAVGSAGTESIARFGAVRRRYAVHLRCNLDSWCPARRR